MKNLLLLLTALFATIISSCDPAFIWEPMQWSSIDGEYAVDDFKYYIPSDGGTYTFICTNYSSFGITSVQEDDNSMLYPDLHISFEADSCQGQWSTVAVENSVLTVQVQPNLTDSSRTLLVVVQSGDAFTNFTFIQSDASDRE